MQDNYGIVYLLRKYANYKRTLFYAVEHGFYLGDFVLKDELKVGKIITFSKERKNIILSKNNNIEVEVIGPYIFYASSYYTNLELESIKKKYGRILLVFPSHSLEEVVYNYNIDKFIEIINKLKKDYDSVFVCLYYADIKKEIYKRYIEENYTIVSAGHKYDEKFLERLKSIILLADYSISNFFGTHVIYSTTLNKPHTIFEQTLEIKKEKKYEDKKLEIYDVAKRKDKKIKEQLQIIKNNYSIYPNYNIEDQKKKLEYLFGFNEVKTKKELNDIFDNKKDRMINE